MRPVSHLENSRGMTVMEVVLAVVILTFIVGSIGYGVTATNKQRAKRMAKTQATLLAGNEIERIEQQIALADSVTDTLYDVERGKVIYEVARTNIHDEPEYGVWGEPVDSSGTTIREIQLDVKRSFDTVPLVRFRLAHGFRQ